MGRSSNDVVLQKLAGGSRHPTLVRLATEKVSDIQATGAAPDGVVLPYGTFVSISMA